MSLPSFVSFLTEEKSYKSQLDILTKKLDSSGVDHDINHKNRSLIINRLLVKKEHNLPGKGNDILKVITTHADEHNKIIFLSPSVDYSGDKKKLNVFYKKHGFQDNKGKTRDYTTRHSMVRYPKGNK
jgi:hypothetical protein